MDQPRSPLRFLAPTALAVFGLAFFAVLAGAGSSAPSDGEKAQSARSASAPAGTQATDGDNSSAGSGRRQGRRPRAYTVKSGDTLGSIAEDTGVSVEDLQRLNPDLDPQALGAGQKLKLRG